MNVARIKQRIATLRTELDDLERMVDEEEAPAAGGHERAPCAACRSAQLACYRGGCVYFIQAGVSGAIKIGVTSFLQGRLADLQAGCPEPLTILAVVPGDRELEQRLHAEFGHLRLHGEWFRPGEKLLARIHTISITGSRVSP